jgi:hypothetical protein
MTLTWRTIRDSVELLLRHLLAPRSWRAEPLTRYERKVHSQFGEDGVIAEIVRRIGPRERTCVEFGAATGVDSNTALLIEQGWQGIFIEANETYFAELQHHHEGNDRVRMVQARVGPDNIDDLLRSAGVDRRLGLVSIDVDGNDLWIWQALTATRPAIVVIEYNGSLPVDRALVQPLLVEMWEAGPYFGASLGALERVGKQKGYTLVHSTSAAVNAFFVADEYARLFPRSELVPRNAFAGGPFADPKGRTYLEFDGPIPPRAPAA